MLISRGRRMFAGGLTSSFLALVLTLMCFAVTAQAQPHLALTLAESGNFQIDTCSQFSPQFSNFLSTPGASIPGACKSSILLWVTNTGTADTVGPITVVNTIVPNMPKSISLLSAAGSGWTCNIAGINLDQAICTRTTPLAKGQTSPAITISALVEDFAQFGMNDAAVALGGGADNAPMALDTSVQFPSAAAPPTFKVVTVHSAPEGLSLLVDGVRITTPHTYAWLRNDQHTITADPANDAPWVFVAFATGGVSHPVGAPAECVDGTPIDLGTCGDGGSGSGPSNPLNGNSLNYVVGANNYQQVTGIFNRP